MGGKKQKSMHKIQRLGEINYNRYGSKMTIIEYIDYANIIVEFENGYKTHSTYRAFKRGEIKNPYDKTVFGVGFIGEGKYPCIINNKILAPSYATWREMLKRCYYIKHHKTQPTYNDCIVCDEWHNYQNFAKWYDENYYEIEGQSMCLDKDILYKGNKIYSPETCVFVPKDINSLFTKRQNDRGTYPIGVNYHIYRRKFQVSCNYKGKSIYLGLYDDITTAFNVYKNYKEKIIKSLADEYKNKIPKKLYDALYNYKVEITD